MTEQEWLECADPHGMLVFLRGKASDRKLRLFAVACCRSVWHLLTDERSQKAVDVLERFACKQATEHELSALRETAEEAAIAGEGTDNPSAAWVAANAVGAGDYADEETDVCEVDAVTFASNTAYSSMWAAYYHNTLTPASTRFELQRKSALGLLRCIFGNPFRPVAVSPSWQSTTVVSLATSIHDERAFDRLPILADALEDAGCDNADILNHCRQAGEHVRGCWAVDLVLGKS